MYNYKISIANELYVIEEENLIFSGRIIRSFFKTKVFIYQADKLLYAKYTVADFLFFNIRNELFFVDSKEIAIIKKKRMNKVNLYYKGNIFTINQLIFKNRTDLLFDNIKVGQLELIQYDDSHYVHLLSCESKNLGRIFAIFDLSLNVNDGLL